MMSGFEFLPYGLDGPSLSLEQAVSAAVLIGRMHESQPDRQPEWHMCSNGCCVVLHEPGKDETAWVVTRDGTIDHVDRYDNIIETIEFDEEILDELERSMLEDDLEEDE